MVVRAELFGEGRGKYRLVELLFSKANRASIDRSAIHPTHQRDHRRRVDPAAKKRAERHVASQTQAHRLVIDIEQLGAPTRFAFLIGLAKLNIPVRFSCAPGSVDHDIVRGSNFADMAKYALGRRHVEQRKVVQQLGKPGICNNDFISNTNATR